MARHREHQFGEVPNVVVHEPLDSSAYVAGRITDRERPTVDERDVGRLHARHLGRVLRQRIRALRPGF